MKHSKKIITLCLVLGFLLANPLTSSAQFDIDPGCAPEDFPCPIDGGLTLLIAAGIGIGAKKAYDSRKKGGAVN